MIWFAPTTCYSLTTEQERGARKTEAPLIFLRNDLEILNRQYYSGSKFDPQVLGRSKKEARQVHSAYVASKPENRATSRVRENKSLMAIAKFWKVVRNGEVKQPSILA